MATVPDTQSMNAASDRDPFNNNSYGTLVDSGYKRVSLPILDVDDFNERVVRAYEDGSAEKHLPADIHLVIAPKGTAASHRSRACAGVGADDDTVNGIDPSARSIKRAISSGIHADIQPPRIDHARSAQVIRSRTVVLPDKGPAR